MATELSKDLVIPAYTDTELTVKKAEKGVPISELGCTEFAIDKFIFSSRKTTKDTQIEHSLKKIPKKVILHSQYKSSQYSIMVEGCLFRSESENYLKGFYKTKSDSSTGFGTVQVSTGAVTENYVKFNDGGSYTYYYAPGVEYTLITMA